MTQVDDTDTYEQRVQAIQLANQPILDDFELWLKQKGLSEKTIQDHVDTSRVFSRYLVLYAHSLRRLDEATDSEVYWFLADWFPKPCLVGFRCQHEGLLSLAQEMLQVDGRNRPRFSRKRC